MSCKVGMNTPRVAHVGIDTLAFQSPGERPREKHVGKFGATVCLDRTVGSLGTDRNAEKTGTYIYILYILYIYSERHVSEQSFHLALQAQRSENTVTRF